MSHLIWIYTVIKFVALHCLQSQLVSFLALEILAHFLPMRQSLFYF